MMTIAKWHAPYRSSGRAMYVLVKETDLDKPPFSDIPCIIINNADNSYRGDFMHLSSEKFRKLDLQEIVSAALNINMHNAIKAVRYAKKYCPNICS